MIERMNKMATQKVKCPLCPYCGKETIPFSIELHDKSGWVCGWTCVCGDIQDWEEYRERCEEERKRNEKDDVISITNKKKNK